MVYLMWTVMELRSARQRAQEMRQGAARGKPEEERELFEPAACPAERLMIVIGVARFVPLQMSNLPLHARFAINRVGENLGSPFQNPCFLPA